MQDPKILDLTVSRPFQSAFCVSEFDNDLTFYHSAHLSPQGGETLFSLTRIPRECVTPATRFHKDHVLLFRGGAAEIETALPCWLEQQGFVLEGDIRFFRAVTSILIEDGFFTCLCALNGTLRVPEVCDSMNQLRWEQYSSETSTIGPILANFVQEELERIDGSGCASFLDHLYTTQSWRQHKLLFDTDDAYLDFAAAVWSPSEFCIWSRPVQLPK